MDFFEIEIFCNTLNVFSVTFDLLYYFLLKQNKILLTPRLLNSDKS